MFIDGYDFPIARCAAANLLGQSIGDGFVQNSFIRSVIESESVLIKDGRLLDSARGRIGSVPKSSYCLIQGKSWVSRLLLNFGATNAEPFKLIDSVWFRGNGFTLMRGPVFVRRVLADLALINKDVRLYRFVRDLSKKGMQKGPASSLQFPDVALLQWKKINSSKARSLAKWVFPQWLASTLLCGAFFGGLAAVGLAVLQGKQPKESIQNQGIAGALSGAAGALVYGLGAPGFIPFCVSTALAYFIDRKVNEALSARETAG